jgi:cell division transport system ATP-binding protein
VQRQSVEIIKFDHVCMSYTANSPVFYDINYTFYHGGFYFITGPNGSGKTSFVKSIYKDISPTQGTIKVFGRDLNTLNADGLSEFLQRMGIIPQENNLFDHLNCIENVALPLKISGMQEKKSKIYAEEMLDWLGLGSYMNQHPSSLSHSQRQKIAIARAAITKPLILLADEPTSNLGDQNEAHHIINLFEELNKTGTTIIIATRYSHLTQHHKYPILLIEKNTLNSYYPSCERRSIYQETLL